MDQIIKDLAALFPDAKDMADLDPADFKDNAGAIFDLVVRARESLQEKDVGGD